jgi:hypothetical protein
MSSQGYACFLTVNPSVTVLISLPDHLVDFIISQLLTNGGHDVAEFGSGDETVVVTIEDLEMMYEYTIPRIILL